MQHKIEIVHNKFIDRNRWNELVYRSVNGTIYNSSLMLDILCPEWEALIVDDYKTVLVLPVKKKYGLTMLSTPPFIQKLALMGEGSKEIISIIGDTMRQKYKLIQLAIDVPDLLPKAGVRTRTNFFIPLDKSYGELYKQYTFSGKKNLKTANKTRFELKEGIEPEKVIQMFKDAYGDVSSYTFNHFDALLTYIQQAEENVMTYGVMNAGGALVYAALLLKDNKRIYYLISAPTKEGKRNGATYFFIDQMLQRNADTDLIFDFEGSDIPNVAQYYQRFGPEVEHYYSYTDNRLSFPLKQIINRKLGI